MAAEQPPQQPHESVHIWIILVELEQSLDAASSFDKLPVLKYAIPNWLMADPLYRRLFARLDERWNCFLVPSIFPKRKPRRKNRDR